MREGRSAIRRRPRSPHFPAKAKHVIHIYLNGGPSQVDTFDPKPLLKKYEGREAAAGQPDHRAADRGRPASPFRFKKYGQSGIEFSEIFARTAQHVDDICVIRSMHGNTPNHEQSMRLMNCGDERLSRPSMGSWLLYGLGTENQNLPGFIAMCPGLPVADVSNWRSAFLPGVFQGTYIDTRHTGRGADREHPESLAVADRPAAAARPVGRAQPPAPQTRGRRRRPRGADRSVRAGLSHADGRHRRLRRQPRAAIHPRSVRPGRAGSAALDRPPPDRARRAVRPALSRRRPALGRPRPIEENHRALAGQCDQAIAALLDRSQAARPVRGDAGPLRRRVRPDAGRRDGQDGNAQLGRDHNHWGFTVWLAGGGVKGGMAYGATDEFGYQAVENRVHVHDLHATILHLLGFDHTRLTYRYAGRDFRLTDVSGTVVRDILA